MAHPYDIITAEVISDELELDWTSEQIESAAEIIENQNEHRSLGEPDRPTNDDFARWKWQPIVDNVKYEADLQIRRLQEQLRDMTNNRDYWRSQAFTPERR